MTMGGLRTASGRCVANKQAKGPALVPGWLAGWLVGWLVLLVKDGGSEAGPVADRLELLHTA